MILNALQKNWAIVEGSEFSTLKNEVQIPCWSYNFSIISAWLWTAYLHPERAFFFEKSQTFGLGQTNWAKIFWDIWIIFGQFISSHFGTMGVFSMFSINQLLFVQKTKRLFTILKKYLGLGFCAATNRDLGEVHGRDLLYSLPTNSLWELWKLEHQL